MQWNYDLILFDLDGTLVDSKRDIADAVNHALQTMGLSPLSETQISSFVGSGVTTLIRKVLGDEGDPRVARLKEHFRAYYEEHLLDTTRLYPGLELLLDQLQGPELAIVTNKPLKMTEKILEGLKMIKKFKWVVAGDSYQVMKPNPQVLSNIFSETKSNPRKRLIIGDSSVDVALGKATQINTCGVTYGFRPEAELRDAGADFIAHNVQDLRELLF